MDGIFFHHEKNSSLLDDTISLCTNTHNTYKTASGRASSAAERRHETANKWIRHWYLLLLYNDYTFVVEKTIQGRHQRRREREKKFFFKGKLYKRKRSATVFGNVLNRRRMWGEKCLLYYVKTQLKNGD